jgi:hypothetical protein
MSDEHTDPLAELRQVPGFEDEEVIEMVRQQTILG